MTFLFGQTTSPRIGCLCELSERAQAKLTRRMRPDTLDNLLTTHHLVVSIAVRIAPIYMLFRETGYHGAMFHYEAHNGVGQPRSIPLKRGLLKTKWNLLVGKNEVFAKVICLKMEIFVYKIRQ